ncbi:MAG TPA: dsRBD fold-containing protein [Yinghuangia sp.]|uniref:dsRBD fold-containing protein n=1 Tax=Yinghuangia sp. YIM S10712 TaxID=3436930 RepID=UPI002BD97DED|nr:dsRBD fold-containing protein [Yinghuangia sp.]
MSEMKHWTVEIHLTEKTGVDEFESGVTVRTHAEARLSTEEGEAMRGWGNARKHPADRDVPQIGDELAAARALSDLAHRLLHAAAADIEASTGELASPRS